MLKRPRKMHLQSEEEMQGEARKSFGPSGHRVLEADGSVCVSHGTLGDAPLATASPLMAPRQLPRSTLMRCPPTAL